MKIPNQANPIIRSNIRNDSHFNAETRKNNSAYPAQISRTGLSGFACTQVEFWRNAPQRFFVSNLSRAGCIYRCSQSCSAGTAARLPYLECLGLCIEYCSGEPFGPTSVEANPGLPPG